MSSIVVPRALIVADHAENRLDEERREPERRLVQQQQPRPAHQGPPDRQHLLLAARHRAGLLVEPFAQAGKRRRARAPCRRRSRASTCARTRPARGFRGRSCAGKRAGPRASGRFPGARSRAARARADRWPSKRDASRGRPDQAADRAQRRRLAGAVRPDQRDDLALIDVQRNAGERGDTAVARDQILDLAASSCRRAEIGFDHLRVGAHGVGQSLRRSSRRDRAP